MLNRDIILVDPSKVEAMVHHFEQPVINPTAPPSPIHVRDPKGIKGGTSATFDAKTDANLVGSNEGCCPSQ
jgi:hypothetical protein